MPVYTVEIDELHADGVHKRMYVETEHSSIERLCSDIRGGPIVVSRLIAKFADDVMEITSREPMLITWLMVRKIMIPTKRFVEYEDVPRG